MLKSIFSIIFVVALWSSCSYKAGTPLTEKALIHANQNERDTILPPDTDMKKNSLPQTEEEWKKTLSAEEYHVLREKGTERPYSGQYYEHDAEGIYVCKGCSSELFRSSTKFDAHCGWPSFYEGINKSNLIEKRDYSHGMTRIEVLCANCGGHLGHVFDDGPQDKTGLRYCINSVSLGFVAKDSLPSR